GITPAHHLDALRASAKSRGVELTFYPIKKADEIDDALEAAKTNGVEAVNVLATALFFTNGRRIIDQTAMLRLPAIFQWPEMADQGGLLGYGPPFAEVYRQ